MYECSGINFITPLQDAVEKVFTGRAKTVADILDRGFPQHMDQQDDTTYIFDGILDAFPEVNRVSVRVELGKMNREFRNTSHIIGR